jgi:hypothetical protein
MELTVQVAPFPVIRVNPDLVGRTVRVNPDAPWL